MAKQAATLLVFPAEVAMERAQEILEALSRGRLPEDVRPEEAPDVVLYKQPAPPVRDRMFLNADLRPKRADGRLWGSIARPAGVLMGAEEGRRRRPEMTKPTDTAVPEETNDQARKYIRRSREEVVRLAEGHTPFSYEEWAREEPPATPEELAEMEELRIAAAALALDLPLVTHNVTDFEPIIPLQILTSPDR